MTKRSCPGEAGAQAQTGGGAGRQADSVRAGERAQVDEEWVDATIVLIIALGFQRTSLTPIQFENNPTRIH